VGAGPVDSGALQVLQKRAGGLLLAPHLGHVKTGVVCQTSFSYTIVGVNF